MNINEWLEYGYKQGFCGPAVCYSHDGLPSTEEEDTQWAEGEDPCMHIVRLYDELTSKEEVEANHSPSVWRALNAGYKTNDR